MIEKEGDDVSVSVFICKSCGTDVRTYSRDHKSRIDNMRPELPTNDVWDLCVPPYVPRHVLRQLELVEVYTQEPF